MRSKLMVGLPVDITFTKKGQFFYSFSILPILLIGLACLSIGCTQPIATTAAYSIQALIDAAKNGDTITVPPGVYYENINFKGKAIAVKSADPNNPSATVIDGGGKDSVVTFGSGATLLEGFTIQNGKADRGGGILINGASPTIRNLIITGNTANNDGGGIAVINSTGTVLEGNRVENNKAGRNGGGVVSTDSYGTKVSNTLIKNNTAGGSGGGLLHSSNTVALPSGTTWITIRDSTLESNVASSEGGGAALTVSSVEVINVNFYDNTASSGGGLRIMETSSTVTSGPQWTLIDSCHFRANTATVCGGGICFKAITGESTGPHGVGLTGNTFENNRAITQGGAIWLGAGWSLTETNNNYAGNTPDNIYR